MEFNNSQDYWNKRYSAGGNSGEGSYGDLAKYKSDYINNLCSEENILNVIEFGCGDGNQTSLFNMMNYTGVDIVQECVDNCRRKLSPRGYTFLTSEEYDNNNSKENYDLSISLDVIYHLVEDHVYQKYISDLLNASSKYCLIYSSNFESYDLTVAHVKHRKFVNDILDSMVGWKLIRNDQNPFGKIHDSKKYGSFASFFLFEKDSQVG